MSKLEKKFLDIFKKNFKVKNLSFETKISEISNWDSLNNVRLIVNLNKCFKKDKNDLNLKSSKTIRDVYNFYFKKL